MTRAAVRIGLVLLLAAVLLPCGACPAAGRQPQRPATGRGEPAVGPPSEFRSKDGTRKGWKVTIPGNRPLATPAVVDGRVFLGGGFGSHEFYAFDAITGKMLWLYRTKDDGPTAAAVADGLRRLQHRKLRAGDPHPRRQAGLEEVAGRSAHEHAGHRRRQGLHGLPQQQGRPQALPGLLRAEDRQGAVEARRSPATSSPPR